MGPAPPVITKNLADRIKDLVSDVAENVNVVSDFVENVVEEGEELRQAVIRVYGLIDNTKRDLARYVDQVGTIDPFGGRFLETPNGVSNAYKNANFIIDTGLESALISAKLDQLRSQISFEFDNDPLRRHLIKEGETLQSIAIEYYSDALQWETIYNHNDLKSTDLIVGNILEIPEEL